MVLFQCSLHDSKTKGLHCLITKIVAKGMEEATESPGGGHFLFRILNSYESTKLRCLYNTHSVNKMADLLTT